MTVKLTLTASIGFSIRNECWLGLLFHLDLEVEASKEWYTGGIARCCMPSPHAPIIVAQYCLSNRLRIPCGLTLLLVARRTCPLMHCCLMIMELLEVVRGLVDI